MAKYIENLSSKTDNLRKLLKKETKWEWTEDRQREFEEIKQNLKRIPELAHFSKNEKNIITTDASTHGLGAILWQEQKDKSLKPIAFASRFLNDAEKKYAINELELLAVVWGLEHFRFYTYGKEVTLKTDHQALQPLLKRNRAHKQYSARLTRWLDRLSHFDVNVQYCAGKHMKLTDYLSRNPVTPQRRNMNLKKRMQLTA